MQKPKIPFILTYKKRYETPSPHYHCWKWDIILSEAFLSHKQQHWYGARRNKVFAIWVSPALSVIFKHLVILMKKILCNFLYFSLINFFLFQGFAHNASRGYLYGVGKNILTLPVKKVLSQGKNSQLLGKFSTLRKNLNLEENAKLLGKFTTLGKILNLGENSQLSRKFSI